MQLTISGHHLDLTDALNEYVTSKLTKLDKHHSSITNTHVILSVEKLVGADIVEVSPPYDHAEITALAAVDTMFEILCLYTQSN